MTLCTFLLCLIDDSTCTTTTNNRRSIAMFSLRQTLRTVLPLLCLLLVSICSSVESFEVAPKVTKNPSTSRQQFHSNHHHHHQYLTNNSQHQNRLSPSSSSSPSSSTSSLIVLDAKKKKTVEEEPVREKKNAFELVLVYMTPWRNPNSIFVYMFTALYFLGKYSEAQSIAKAASGVL